MQSFEVLMVESKFTPVPRWLVPLLKKMPQKTLGRIGDVEWCSLISAFL